MNVSQFTKAWNKILNTESVGFVSYTIESLKVDAFRDKTQNYAIFIYFKFET